MNWNELKAIDLAKITKVDFPDDQYYKVETLKKQITIHHTVSGDSGSLSGVGNDISHLTSDTSHVAVHFFLSRDGGLYQLYSTKFWGHHLGLKADFISNQGFKDSGQRNDILNKASISIEIDSWGWLKKQSNGTFKNAYDQVVNVPVQEYPNKFRGEMYYEKYTEAQLKTLGELMLFINQKYNIPLDYNNDMWDVSKNALSGKAGVYTHVSYRSDKSDCHPQPELIEMLKSLKKS